MTSFLLASLGLVLLYQGMVSNAHYSITVPEEVFAQKGLCTDVPCTFTVPKWYSKSTDPFYLYWFKIVRKRYYLIWINIWVTGTLMATNDLRQKADITNIKLTGDPKKGDCSFTIADARLSDWGWYYLRIHNGERFQYEFISNPKVYHTNPKIVVTDLKKPLLWKPASTDWGENLTFSCIVSNSCPTTNPQITWSFMPKGSTLSLWAIQQSSWTWTYGMNLTFLPSLENEGQILLCMVRYPGLKETVEDTIQLNLTYSPEVLEDAKCKNQSTGLVCRCAFRGWPQPKIQWYMDGKNLTGNPSSREDVNITSTANGTHVISYLCLTGNLNKDEPHLIRCKGTNPLGVQTLNVFSTPDKTQERQKAKAVPKIVLGSLAMVSVSVILLYYYNVHAQRWYGRHFAPPAEAETETAEAEPSVHFRS